MSLLRPQLLDHLSVTPLDDGLVAVTIHLPADLVRDYCRFLQTLVGFFTTVQNKTTIAQAEQRAKSYALNQQAQQTLAAYRSRVVDAFDRYTSQGLIRKEAIQSIAAELRADQHPWRSADLVRITLVECDRGGRFSPARK
ncbi:hypothetical protein JCM30471_07740 [Desulfuromonas carbonis]|uniref:hypothetical protein n=1 Tax=Desulfuromonas sp. DDH964 TaxID=1823759 RepID=UPI00078B84FB|nr:hypothetical protein [Desulfuromonas sp. DDH964]AMV72287.1 hypothetical protein DBW_1935 [Desulfuromonas sp. DDH964]